MSLNSILLEKFLLSVLIFNERSWDLGLRLQSWVDRSGSSLGVKRDFHCSERFQTDCHHINTWQLITSHWHHLQLREIVALNVSISYKLHPFIKEYHDNRAPNFW